MSFIPEVWHKIRKKLLSASYIIPDGTTYYIGYIVQDKQFDLTADIWSIKRVRVVGTAYEITWAEKESTTLIFDSGIDEYKFYNYS